MQIRSVLPALLFLVPVASIASEGMIYGAIYQCDADEINRVMVDTCTSRFPGLAKEADVTLAAWRDRNLDKANAVRKACSNEFSAAAASVSASDLEAVRKRMADIKAEIFSNFEAEIRKRGIEPCHEALKQLQQAVGPLEIR
jgi:hypothetical protein